MPASLMYIKCKQEYPKKLHGHKKNTFQKVCVKIFFPASLNKLSKI